MSSAYARQTETVEPLSSALPFEPLRIGFVRSDRTQACLNAVRAVIEETPKQDGAVHLHHIWKFVRSLNVRSCVYVVHICMYDIRECHMYIYIYIYTYIHIYIYIYICVRVRLQEPRSASEKTVFQENGCGLPLRPAWRKQTLTTLRPVHVGSISRTVGNSRSKNRRCRFCMTCQQS